MHACQRDWGHGVSDCVTGRNCCSAEDFWVVPEHEIAAAIAAARGALLIASHPWKASISTRAEPCIAVAAAKSSSTVEYELRCFSRRWRSPASTSARGHEERCLPRGFEPARAPRGRPSVHVSHSCFAGLSASLTVRLTTSRRNASVAVLLKSLESQVTPEPLSPFYSRSVPARWGCVRCPLVQTGGGPTALKAPSTSSRCVPSVWASASRSNHCRGPLHRRRPTNRDFVPWRFSDASRRRAWMGSQYRRPRNLHSS